MAVFVAIPDTDLDANSPITENLMLALRDNPKAIAEGDATAPKIANAALVDNTISGAKLINASIGYSKILNSTSDTSITIPAKSYYTIPAGLYTIIYPTSVMQFQMFASGIWASSSTSSLPLDRMSVISDGANFRFYNDATITRQVYIRKAS